MLASECTKLYRSEMYTRTVKGKVRRERRFWVPCTVPGCKNESLVKPSDADRGMCRNCAARVNGKLGFEALMRKYGGYRPAMIAIAELLRKQSSKPELMVVQMLRDLQATFVHSYTYFWQGEDREHCAILDLFVQTPDGPVVIQVNGEYVHDQPERAAADKLLHSVLPFPILTITDTEIRNKAGQARVRAALQTLVC